jgi:hypothetical protein
MTKKTKLRIAAAALGAVSLSVGTGAVHEAATSCVRYDRYSEVSLTDGAFVPERRFNYRDCDGNPLPTPEEYREAPYGEERRSI